MEKQPFWENTYKEEESPNTFNGGQPSLDVIEVFEKYVNSGKVLDLGCGDGRNSLYAATRGFDVTAIDISESGINKTQQIAEDSGLSIQAKVQDMRLFKSEPLFDVVISHGCLHLISREEWTDVIRNIKKSTKPGGYNIVVVFTDKIPPSEDMAPFTKGLFKEDELYEIYSDWTIIDKRSHVFDDEHDGGRIKHRHAVNRLIAYK